VAPAPVAAKEARRARRESFMGRRLVCAVVAPSAGGVELNDISAACQQQRSLSWAHVIGAQEEQEHEFRTVFATTLGLTRCAVPARADGPPPPPVGGGFVLLEASRLG
jgi:hypothetical protein